MVKSQDGPEVGKRPRKVKEPKTKEQSDIEAALAMEKRAAGLVRLAIQLGEAGNTEAMEQRLAQIVEQFSETEAAKEVRRMLIARDEIASVRSWTDVSGEFHVDAEFVDLYGEVVRLRKTDGNVISVAIEKLSEVDRLYVRYRMALEGRMSAE